jgi:hypothetical protein
MKLSPKQQVSQLQEGTTIGRANIGMAAEPDHIFISYATEDGALARWLTLKLTNEGYKVWCFEFQMLGGESFPKEIDQAIKAHTFRMLGLISHHSVKKQNPIKEWTLAQAIGTERGLDFLIPINVDGVKPTELPWTLADTNWISFCNPGWASGFLQLLRLLEKLHAPKLLTDGPSISAKTFIPEGIVTTTAETLFSNRMVFKNIPSCIHEYSFARKMTPEEITELRQCWAYWYVNDGMVFSLSPPPEPIACDLIKKTGRAWDIVSVNSIENIPIENMTVHLLSKAVRVLFLVGGCRLINRNDAIYFPAGLFPRDRIEFTGYSGKKTYVVTNGRSTFYRRGQSQTCKYYLGFRHHVGRIVNGRWCVYFKLYLRITDNCGVDLDPRPALTRRKAITRNWWNDKLLKRYMALCKAIQCFQDLRRFRNSTDEVLLEHELTTFCAPYGLNEKQFSLTEKTDSDDDGSIVMAELTSDLDGGEDES